MEDEEKFDHPPDPIPGESVAEKHELFARPGESRYPVPRGYEPRECKWPNCLLNDRQGLCAAQKYFGLDEEGKCTGFIPRPAPIKTDSE